MTKTTTILNVEGMSCRSCIAHVGEVLAIDGVTNVDVRFADRQVAIEHEPRVSPDHLIAALGVAGFEATVRCGHV